MGMRRGEVVNKRLAFQTALVYIKFVKRNCFLTLTDVAKVPYITKSIGSYGYKNATKKTPTAVEETLKAFFNECVERGIRNIDIKLKGVNRLRSSSLRKLLEFNQLNFTSIEDTTSVPFGGCRAKKANLRKGGF